ncbi:MAG: TIGR03936 family radical SAM-associated protein [Christensenellales bacterium]
MMARFSKGEGVRFSSHLDTQRLFQRAMRRAKIPCRFSQGYNPHPVMSFASALPVGATSEGEYVDIALAQELASESFVERMNGALPEAVRIVGARPIEDSFPSLTSKVYAARYRVDFLQGGEWAAPVRHFLSKDSVFVEKQGKGGLRSLDIRPLVYELTLKGDGLDMLLAASSAASVSPKLLLKALYGGESSARLCRLEMYADRQGTSLFDWKEQ